MKVSDLIHNLQRMQEQQGDLEVMVLDSFNGAGVPRTINLGPKVHVVTPEDAEETGDCEEIVGQSIVVLGFGCY